ncbi:MAG: hypothetical protein Q9165_006134 [Trypethelium subeluteriae]
MVLEATMIVVDNSESSRNGDYVPSRFDAQADAVNLIFQAKTQSNPESAVGLMSMGGAGPEVLTTLTTDIGKILDGLHPLKHRQNKSQRQRIIVFTCSPMSEDEKAMIKLAKRMKKINIAIDFIAFGDLSDETTKKLDAFNENIKGGEGSHLAKIPPGPNLLSDSIVTTPILAGEGMGVNPNMGGGGGEGGQGGGNDFEFGVDPSMDPELAIALRMSLEEENARKEKEKKEREEQEAKANLEGIPEGDEKQPLLDQNGEASGSGSAAQDGEQEKKDKDEGDKMDTA